MGRNATRTLSAGAWECIRDTDSLFNSGTQLGLVRTFWRRGLTKRRHSPRIRYLERSGAPRVPLFPSQ